MVTRVVARAFTPAVILVAAGSLFASSYLRERALVIPESAPGSWLKAAKSDDRLVVPGHDILYWGNPRARYCDKNAG